MTSRKTPGSKRAALPRASDHTKQFAKDWARLAGSGRYDMNRIKEVMLLLIADDNRLGPEWLDHAVKGQRADHRECHIGGDFLMIYQLHGAGNNEMLSFVRAGSHAELFE